MDRYATKGLKKLFSLTRTKLRLAQESGTIDTKPSPLPLAMLFGAVQLRTVAECEAHWQALKDGTDYGDDRSAACTTLQLIDIIECVKYRFEHPDYMPLMGDEQLAAVEAECRLKGAPLTILLMTENTEADAVYFGDEPPAGTNHYSRVISGVAPLLHYAFRSSHLSEGLKLKNIRIAYGNRTLIANAVYHALNTLVA